MEYHYLVGEKFHKQLDLHPRSPTFDTHLAFRSGGAQDGALLTGHNATIRGHATPQWPLKQGSVAINTSTRDRELLPMPGAYLCQLDRIFGQQGLVPTILCIQILHNDQGLCQLRVSVCMHRIQVRHEPLAA